MLSEQRDADRRAFKYGREANRLRSENSTLRSMVKALTDDNDRLREEMTEVRRRALWGSDLRKCAAKLGVPQETLYRMALQASGVEVPDEP